MFGFTRLSDQELSVSEQGKRCAMQEASTKKIYDVHSVFYDATFGRLVKRRVKSAMAT